MRVITTLALPGLASSVEQTKTLTTVLTESMPDAQVAMDGTRSGLGNALDPRRVACMQANRQTAKIWPFSGGKYLFTFFLRYLNP